MEKWYDMRSQDVVDIMQWNCLAWQQSTSSGHPFCHPKLRNCPHQIDPFPARNNPSNACLCILLPAFLSANRVSPLNETLFQSTYCQMKWRLARLAFRPCIITWYITIVNSPEDVLLLANYLPISCNTGPGTKRFSFSQDSARWMINYSCRQQLHLKCLLLNWPHTDRLLTSQPQ